MKLHLPKTLRKILLVCLLMGAGINHVEAATGFTTTFGNCNQAAIADIALTNTWLSGDAAGSITASVTSLTNSAGNVSLQTGGAAGSNASLFTPNTNVGTGSPWTTTISYTCTDWASIGTMQSMELNMVMYTAGGGWQNTTNDWSPGDIAVTVTLTHSGTTLGSFSCEGVFAQLGSYKGWYDKINSISLSGSSIDISNISGAIDVTIALSETLNKGVCIGLKDISHNTRKYYYWESASSEWSGDKWAATDGGSPLVSLPSNEGEVNVMFNNDETATITMSGTVSVDNMSIAAGQYTFKGTDQATDSLNVTGELSISSTATMEDLSISAGSITVNNGGTLNLTDVSLSSAIDNSGTLVLDGTINLQDLTATSTSDSISATENGFNITTSTYEGIITGNGTVTNNADAWQINGAAVNSATLSNGTLTVTSTGTVYYATSTTTAAIYDGTNGATALMLNGGTLQLNTAPTQTGFIGATNAGGMIDLNGQNLSQAALGTLESAIQLTGAAGSTYDLGAVTTLKENVSLADSWKGTVQLSNITTPTQPLDLSQLGKAGSRISMGDVSVSTLTSPTTASVSCTSLSLGNGLSQVRGALVLTADTLTLSSADARLEAASLETTGTALTLCISGAVRDALNATAEASPITLISLDEAYRGGATLQVLDRAAVSNKYVYTLQWENGGKNLVYATTLNPNFVRDAIEGETHNGKAGIELLQQAFLDSDPQASAPGSALASVLNAVERLCVNDETAAAVAGSSIASLGAALAGDMERQLKAIRNRTTTMGVGGDQVIHTNMPYCNAWINAEGSYSELSHDNTAAGYTLNNWGGTVGLDIDVDPYLTAGFAVTAMYGDFESDGPDTLKGDVETYYFTAFARYAKSAWTHTFVASYGLMESVLDRSVSASAFHYDTEGKTDGCSAGFLYELGYVLALDEDATACLQPVVNVMFRHTSIKSYTEEGCNAALDVDKQSMTTLTFGFGARYQAVIGEDIYNRTSVLEARVLGKAHVGDRYNEADVALAGSSVTASVRSAELGVMGVEAGIGLVIPMGDDDGSIFADASAEYNSGYYNANATLGYRINF